MSGKGTSMKRIGARSGGLPFNSSCGMMPSGKPSFDMTVLTVFHTKIHFGGTGSLEKCR